MASFNKVILMGNLTRDVELRYTPSGTAVTEIGLAVNDRRKDANGQWVDETTFVDITLWGRTAEVCNEYLGKGSGVLIEGRLKLDQWDDKQTGRNAANWALCWIDSSSSILAAKGVAVIFPANPPALPVAVRPRLKVVAVALRRMMSCLFKF